LVKKISQQVLMEPYTMLQLILPQFIYRCTGTSVM